MNDYHDDLGEIFIWIEPSVDDIKRWRDGHTEVDARYINIWMTFMQMDLSR